MMTDTSRIAVDAERWKGLGDSGGTNGFLSDPRTARAGGQRPGRRNAGQRLVTRLPYNRDMTNSSSLPSPGGPQNLLARFGAPPVEVFVCHATRDVREVEMVRSQAEALGISVYLAEHDVQPGFVLAAKIEEAIRRCQAVIVLITTASVTSTIVQQEIGLARAHGKPLIPMVEKGIDIRQLGILVGVEYLELDLDPEHQAETLAKMRKALERLVMAQIPLNVSVLSVTQNTGPDPATALGLVVLVILGVLIMAALSNGSESSG